QMRAIEREANYRPYEGKARVFLIDDADKLNDSSANALLKTLEEPPATSHLILITARPGMLLPTIRSRCQAIRFSPLTVDEIEASLPREKGSKPAEVRLRSRLARGSMGRAMQTDLEEYESRRAVVLRVLEAVEVVNEDLSSQLAKIAQGLSSDEAARWIDEIEILREQLIVNVNRKVATDALFLAMVDGRPAGLQYKTLTSSVRRI